MSSTDVALVLGTRPEIVKLAGVARLLGPQARIVWSGQHWDPALTTTFFAQYGLPRPHHLLKGVGGEPRGRQIGHMVSRLSDHLAARPPAAVVVQGDTNTAAAGALAAHCAGIPVVHVEAGLRSFDPDMPEEANRRLIAPLADLHCAPTATAAAHLLREGIPPERVVITGNTVVEATLETLPAEAEAHRIVTGHGVTPGGYVLATIHRPENTNDAARLAQILDQLAALDLPVLLPLHPRTRAAVEAHGLRGPIARLRRIDPLDHAGFLALARHCRLLVSDSGGVQEECTVLKRPLVVVRNSTERPEAVQAGFARLARPGHELARALRDLLADEAATERLARLPSPYGTGQASAEIVAAVRGRYLASGPPAERFTGPPAERFPEPPAAPLPGPGRTPVAASAARPRR
ncbi:non-hydrolyzing UDP-N-acetylglucosamine 2-epimerase [Streptomyces sp. CBMA156]|uniref:non-hydrolyzing UDP-N-acetylglucosamine 2-epimerase n=1 Tax=Streptomyces sp. CBMA156 TaxID=1930280 RepID=UPI001662170A|nr:UDP-N-acetylglucosamine 2-epimerase (non-hydrolyzing) [Streptomyces sp. CBMA156]MBD0672429.1 UDP-N-acetylglucosamine 2-epimerase [Streptomyces sp. CBMA156]